MRFHAAISTACRVKSQAEIATAQRAVVCDEAMRVRLIALREQVTGDRKEPV